MAIVQIILAIFSRTAGRVLNTTFAWATILFGRVPPRQQIYLLVMAFGSMAWVEDKLRKIRVGAEASNERRQSESLPAVDRELKTAELPFEEWKVPFRKELLLERQLHGLDAGAAHELPSRH